MSPRADIECLRRRSRGMTLIEVLIATSLLALISILVVSGLRLGFRFWERAGETRAGNDDIAFAQQFLRRAIETAYPRLAASAPGAAVIDFSGDADQLAFVTPALRSLADAGFSEVVLRSTATPSGESLSVEYRRDAADAAATEPLVSEILIVDAKDVRFSFAPRGSDEWRSNWADEASLPSLIRVEVDFPVGDHRQWPPLIIAPAIDVDQSCRYDALTKYCRGRRR